MLGGIRTRQKKAPLHGAREPDACPIPSKPTPAVARCPYSLFRKIVYASAPIDIKPQENIISHGMHANKPFLISAAFADRILFNPNLTHDLKSMNNHARTHGKLTTRLQCIGSTISAL